MVIILILVFTPMVCTYPPEIDKAIWSDFCGVCLPRMILPNN
ncbi:hypothetical protein LINPERHAP2_LOCUS28305 [Linum perenne]